MPGIHVPHLREGPRRHPIQLQSLAALKCLQVSRVSQILAVYLVYLEYQIEWISIILLDGK